MDWSWCCWRGPYSEALLSSLPTRTGTCASTVPSCYTCLVTCSDVLLSGLSVLTSRHACLVYGYCNALLAGLSVLVSCYACLVHCYGDTVLSSYSHSMVSSMHMLTRCSATLLSSLSVVPISDLRSYSYVEIHHRRTMCLDFKLCIQTETQTMYPVYKFDLRSN